jgi:hypothetical protein
MPNPGNHFKNELIKAIISWNIPDVSIYSEVWVGSRFVGAKRRLDIVIEANKKIIGIEAKTQQTSGTAYQKLPYTLEDARKSPIPTLIVFSGSYIQPDVKAMLVSSGLGIEIEWTPEKGFISGVDVFKQRIMIELGLDWLREQRDKIVYNSNNKELHLDFKTKKSD